MSEFYFCLSFIDLSADISTTQCPPHAQGAQAKTRCCANDTKAQLHCIMYLSNANLWQCGRSGVVHRHKAEA